MYKEKSTNELFNEITKSKEINLFLENNKAALSHPSAATYLSDLLQKKHMDKSALIQRSGLDRVYVYQILSGKKASPSRSKLLALALALQLTLDETQHLLKYGHVSELYPRNRADSILIYAINNKLSVIETNTRLAELNLFLLE